MPTSMDADRETRSSTASARLFRSRVWVVLLSLTLASCLPNEQIRDRFEYWSAESNAFFSEPRTLRDVHSWLRSHNVIYTFEDADIADGDWSMTLEKVYFDGWWCDWVNINVDITVDDSKLVQDHGISIKRACWWWF